MLICAGNIFGIIPMNETVGEDWYKVEANGMMVCPGFVDLHAHFREPGEEWKETIRTGGLAAAHGGFTTVCVMPNTAPPIDNIGTLEYVKNKSRLESVVRVMPIASITSERAGRDLSPMSELASAGAVAFSDDGEPVMDAVLMRHALAYARLLGLPVINHAEDKVMLNGGVMSEGSVANRLGLPASPSYSEAIMVERDVNLAQIEGAHLHVPHVSTKHAVEYIRLAKSRGVHVTAEVAPHHLVLTDAWTYGEHGSEPFALGPDAYDTNTRVNPPLRSDEDREAVIEALSTGTIDAIATDHAPHSLLEKELPFEEAAPGISGLETAFGLTASLVHEGRISFDTLIERLTSGPAAAFGIKDAGSLKPGMPADLVFLSLNDEWIVDVREFASLGKNTPLEGCKLRGRVVLTMSHGCIVHDAR